MEEEEKQEEKQETQETQEEKQEEEKVIEGLPSIEKASPNEAFASLSKEYEYNKELDDIIKLLDELLIKENINTKEMIKLNKQIIKTYYKEPKIKNLKTVINKYFTNDNDNNKKEYQKEYQKNYYINNPEKQKELKEKRRINSKIYYNNNKEVILTKMKIRYNTKKNNNNLNNNENKN